MRSPSLSRSSASGLEADLPEQFVLGRSVPDLEGWVTRSVGSWTLSRHPTLPCISVVGPDNRETGWILGYPIDEDGVLHADGGTLKAPADGPGFQAAVDRIGGRYLAVLVDSPHPRIYPDPAGSYSSVFCPDMGLVASTSHLIPYSEETEDNVPLIEELGIPRTNSMYPVGLTPRRGVWRLLPNHYLDLDRWESRRYWTSSHVTETVPSEEWATDLANIIKRQVEAVARVYPCYLPFTAGWDSRTVLACARSLVSELTLYTVQMPDWGAAIDAALARRITRRLDLTYESLAWITPRQEDVDEWAFRTARGTGERRGSRAMTTYKTLSWNRVRLLGNVGDLARGYYWAKQPEVPPVTPETLASRCGVRDSEEGLRQLAKWIDEAPDVDPIRLWDLFYIEQRLGCWAGVWPYGEYLGPGFVLFPMCHRRLIEGMISPDPAQRRSACFNRKIIQVAWPELLKWPVNRLPFDLRVRAAVRRRIKRFFKV